jgi:F0F1-type ATP synthase gamma subunit
MSDRKPDFAAISNAEPDDAAAAVKLRRAAAAHASRNPFPEQVDRIFDDLQGNICRHIDEYGATVDAIHAGQLRRAEERAEHHWRLYEQERAKRMAELDSAGSGSAPASTEDAEREARRGALLIVMGAAAVIVWFALTFVLNAALR